MIFQRDPYSFVPAQSRNRSRIFAGVGALLVLTGSLAAPAQEAAPAAKPDSEKPAPAALPAAVTDTNAAPRSATNAPAAGAETNALSGLTSTNAAGTNTAPADSNIVPGSEKPAALLAALSMTNRVGETAPKTNSTGRPDYASFKILLERNIFDPTRYPRSTGRGPRTTTTRRVRTEGFGLVGTISYEKGTIAFFDGTGSEYRKALKVGDTIAGHTVTEIAPDSVKLEAAGKAVELHIGAQMRKPDQGAWEVSGSSEGFSSLTSTNLDDKGEGVEEGTESGTAPAAPASSGAESDILKRLMQKREQELNK